MKKATGKVIKALRKHFDYTQEEIAKSINITLTTMANIENGRAGIDIEKLDRLAKLYNIDIGLILQLAQEVIAEKDDAWLANALRYLKMSPRAEEIEDQYS